MTASDAEETATPPSHTTHDAEDDVRNRDIRIYVDGAIVHRDEAKVSVYDSGFLLGDGMWEGMRLYNSKWAFFNAHMDRLFAGLKGGHEGRLGNFYITELTLLFLPLFLFFQKLLFASDIAAIALCCHVFSHCAYCGPGDDLAANCGLHGNFEQLARDQVFQFLANSPTTAFSMAFVNNKT